MAAASRVLLPEREPNWYGPATFATSGTSGRPDAFAGCLSDVTEQRNSAPIVRIPNVFDWFG